MHVVLLNQAFHPDVVATAQMGKDLADELVRRGHTVTAVASRSIYGEQGASLAARDEITVEGAPRGADGRPGCIRVVRVGQSFFGKGSLAARALDFGLFYIAATWRVLTLPRADVVVSFTTPPFIAMVGLAHRLVRGGKAVQWVMDLYPEVPIAFGVMKRGGVSAKAFGALARLLLRRSDMNVVLGRCMRDRVLALGAPADRLALIEVWSDLAVMPTAAREENAFRREWGVKDDEFLVMYSGNLGLGHDARTLCEAMALLKDRSDIRFIFVGSGKRKSEVEAFIRERGLAQASWKPYVPREKLGESLAAADAHLISLKEGMEGLIVPSKLFGVMAVARPGVFVGHPSSEIARVLEESGGGVCVREGDAAGLAKVIASLADDRALARRMGEAGRAALVGRYDASTLCTRWAGMLETLCASRR